MEDTFRMTEKALKMRQKREKKLELQKQLREKNEPPKLSLAEEVGNAVTHGIGALLALTDVYKRQAYSNFQRYAWIYHGADRKCACVYFSR